MRTGGPPKDDFHNFLCQNTKGRPRTAMVRPRRSQKDCMDLAMDSNTGSHIGYSVDFQDLEQDYKHKCFPECMRAVAAYVNGKEYRFDDPRYAQCTLEMLGAILERQKAQLARQCVKALPPRLGKEKKAAYDMTKSNVEEQKQFNHDMADFNKVSHKMKIDEYLGLLKEQQFESITDFGY